MQYYKINRFGADQYIYQSKLTIFKDELFTEKEMLKYKIPFSFAEIVNVSPKNTYFIFGVRKQLV